jgi:prepilin-type N-terminal cleavage/methylation domain-containing protein
VYNLQVFILTRAQHFNVLGDQKMNSSVAIRRAEKGFTLVELAIVMIIIGLLLGGLLKGQELIANARVTSTVAAIKNIDAATTGFLDKYDALPGDMVTPNTRIPSCTNVPCSAAGDANGLVGSNAFGAAPAGETLAFFPQLAAADFIGGVVPMGGALAWGSDFPEAPVGGGFHVSYITAAALGNLPGLSATGMTLTNMRSGHYLALHNLATGAVAAAAANYVMTPSMAFRIDNKYDDGRPPTGSVLAGGAPGAAATGCATTTTDAALYSEVLENNLCYLFIRFHK